jgi:alpha-ketoglutarate-dependent taurine dioxygenase
MDRAEGDELLADLMRWATRPQYVYRHKWQMGDLVIWDNAGAMHRVQPFDFKCGRRLHRTTLLGEEPFTAIGSG